jgi:hypothetical protein
MQLCVYVVMQDYGFAPNPFFRYCTIAACTPNHRNMRLTKGDWLMGHASKAVGQRLIYAMEVSEVLDFDAYYTDPRFQVKKPRFDRTWQEACGDNIYHRGRNGKWVQEPTWFHNYPEARSQDTQHPIVFISQNYYYFGENARTIPKRFAGLLWERCGCKCHRSEKAEAFVEWLETNFTPGVLGNPRDLHKWAQGVEGYLPRQCTQVRTPATGAKGKAIGRTR